MIRLLPLCKPYEKFQLSVYSVLDGCREAVEDSSSTPACCLQRRLKVQLLAAGQLV